MKIKKRVSFFVRLIVAILAVSGAVTLVNLQIQISEKKEQQELLQAQLDSQKLKNAELESIVSGENSEEYIAEIAREKLDYVKPGEKVFVDISSK